MTVFKSCFIGLLSFIFVCTSFSCEEKNPPDEDKNNQDNQVHEPVNLKETTPQVVSSDNKFGFALFQKIVQSENHQKNIFISPTSVSVALAMTYNGAADSTKEAMERTLKKKGLSTHQINQTYRSLIDSLVNADPNVTLNIANAIYHHNEFEVEQQFKDVNHNYYDAQVDPLNFDDPASVNIINNWVANHTNNKIEKIIDQLNSEEIMALLNAIYFKGIWKCEFDDSLTKDRPFYMTDGTQKAVPTMQKKDTFNYFSNNRLKIVELPYGSGAYSMVILLPKNKNGIGTLISDLNVEKWDQWMEGMSKTEVKIELPKFTFKYKKKLNEVLKDMGMNIAFDRQKADFSNINDAAGKELYISRVKHKAFVQVNEQGTEAAAVTAVVVGVTSAGPSFESFKADHPFVFAIKEKSTNALVFMGRVMEPVINNP